MRVIEAPMGISGLKVIEPDVYLDGRGYFAETYNAPRYADLGIDAVFVQDNESRSSKGVVRGLHWQAAPHTQAKLVRVVSGAVMDVLVDVRRGSPTFGRHVSVQLTGENHKQVFVPRGLAHGFITLRDGTVFSYKCDNVYCPGSERGLRFDDPALGIKWPDVGVPLVLSDRDMCNPVLADIEPWEDAR